MKYSREAVRQIMDEHNISYNTLSRVTGVDTSEICKYFSGRERFSAFRFDGMLIDRVIDIIVEKDLHRPEEAAAGNYAIAHSPDIEKWYDDLKAMVNREEVRAMSKACRKIFSILNESIEDDREPLVLDRLAYNSGLWSKSNEAYVKKMKEIRANM